MVSTAGNLSDEQSMPIAKNVILDGTRIEFGSPMIMAAFRLS